MGWIEYLLIVAGSSLEIFVAMECQGSLVQKINKKQLTAIYSCSLPVVSNVHRVFPVKLP